ncbi:MAG: glycosyltransferase [Candidatus Bathyarchaeia archaeon]
MRVVIFSWEYPPRIVGKLADYVAELASLLVKNDVETHVITYHEYATGKFVEGDVLIHRVTNPVRTHISILTWVLTLNQEIERVAASIYYQTGGGVDLMDVQDWHFIPAAVTLKKALNMPFIYSVESFEDHRAPGANMPLNMAIKSIEWLGTYEAHKIIVKSEWMAEEAKRIYKVPEDKIIVTKPTTTGWIRRILKTYRNTADKGASIAF